MTPRPAYAPPARPRRRVTASEYGVLAAWLRALERATPEDRTMIAINAREDFKGWPCIVCVTCAARRAAEGGQLVRPLMTISGVVDHYRRAFGYVHELAIADDTVQVVS